MWAGHVRRSQGPRELGLSPKCFSSSRCPHEGGACHQGTRQCGDKGRDLLKLKGFDCFAQGVPR